MKYFGMFAGAGGFECAISRNTKWVCVGYSEIDKYAIQCYSHHFTSHKNYGDATAICYKEVPDFDLLVGGSPCQNLSLAGNREGLEGEESRLFFEFIRCLKRKQPAYFIWENVKGALSSNQGEDFARVQIEFSEAGYSIQWSVLNSKDFGVPQNRERVFVFGVRGESIGEILPFKGDDFQIIKPDKIAYCLDANYAKGCNDFRKHNRTVVLSHSRDSKGKIRNYHISEIAGTIKQPSGNQENRVLQLIKPDYSQGNRIYGTDGCACSLQAQSGGLGAKTGLYAVLTPDRENKRQHGRRFKEDGEPMFTLTGQDRHGVAMPINKELRIRRLTPLECLRLQGFPDDWFDGIGLSDSQKYRLMGNAVTVNVIEAIVKKMEEVHYAER